MCRWHADLRKFAIAISTAAVVLSLTASLAMAGEVTGSGKRENQNQGKSWCSFSGLNDRLEGEGPTDTQAQSYGQDVAAGLADPHEANPGLLLQPEPHAAATEPEQDALTSGIWAGPATSSPALPSQRVLYEMSQLRGRELLDAGFAGQDQRRSA